MEQEKEESKRSPRTLTRKQIVKEITGMAIALGEVGLTE